MVFVPFQRDVRVSLGVVTLGTPDRLRGCLEALVGHESRHDFTVVVVVNADTPDGAPPELDLPEGVLADPVPVNLGWAGGLHRARAQTDAELLVWVQDDMTPEPGWLDAMVDAADAHPGVGAFGSVRVDEHGEVLLSNAGAAHPPDDIDGWNDTDRTAERLPTSVTSYDWVTSRGLLTRARTFDDVGGPDPRIWPLSYSDKDYCTHVRCHGWDVALVPEARVRHTMLQTAPSQLRVFLLGWHAERLNRRWSAALAQVSGRSSAVVEHSCADWRTTTAGPLEAAAGAEASRMVVPLSRALAEEVRTAAHWHTVREDDLVAQVEHYRRAWQDTNTHAEALTAALADAVEQLGQARRRARRLRRRLSRAEAQVAPPPTGWARVRARLRGWRHDG
jgi:GT2 family glycosyltransferase